MSGHDIDWHVDEVRYVTRTGVVHRPHCGGLSRSRWFYNIESADAPGYPTSELRQCRQCWPHMPRDEATR